MKHILLLLLIPIFLACQTEVIEPPNKYIKDGIIVWQKPLWKVPHDTACYVISLFKPFYIFDNKVLVSTYSNAQGGIRCMEIETGMVVWEKTLGLQTAPQGLSLSINNPYFNKEGRFMIVSIGDWGNKRHARINIDTGATEWELSIEAFASIAGMGDHYYCTVYTSDDVCPIYRVDVNTGIAEHFYTSTLAAHPNFNAQRSAMAHPFIHNGKEYLILDELRLVDPSTSLVENFFSLMDTETKELLITHQPIDSPVSKVELVDGDLYLFTGNGYNVLSIDSLTIKRQIRFYKRGNYVYHQFFGNKLFLGILPYGIAPEIVDDSYHFVIDKYTDDVLVSIPDYVYQASIIEDYIYISGVSKFKAFNINTGKCVLNFPLPHKSMPGVATYRNANGKKFVITEDIGFTYCFEAI